MTIEAVPADDFERLARERMPHMAYEFLASGAADEATLRWNRESYERCSGRCKEPGSPRVIANVFSHA